VLEIYFVHLIIDKANLILINIMQFKYEDFSNNNIVKKKKKKWINTKWINFSSFSE
jgi:hypothetical protein